VILSRVRGEPTPPELVVLDLSAAARVDMQSAHTLAGMADELTAQGIQFHAVEPRSSVRERLRHETCGWQIGRHKPLYNCRRSDRPLSAGSPTPPFCSPNEPHPTE